MNPYPAFILPILIIYQEYLVALGYFVAPSYQYSETGELPWRGCFQEDQAHTSKKRKHWPSLLFNPEKLAEKCGNHENVILAENAV